jgi:hypothetical protein
MFLRPLFDLIKGGWNVISQEELIYRMGYDYILQFYYDPKENTFHVCDQFGSRVVNILKALTPNDIFLFKQDPGYNVFFHKDNSHILCEILTDYD